MYNPAVELSKNRKKYFANFWKHLHNNIQLFDSKTFGSTYKNSAFSRNQLLE